MPRHRSAAKDIDVAQALRSRLTDAAQGHDQSIRPATRAPRHPAHADVLSPGLSLWSQAATASPRSHGRFRLRQTLVQPACVRLIESHCPDLLQQARPVHAASRGQTSNRTHYVLQDRTDHALPTHYPQPPCRGGMNRVQSGGSPGASGLLRSPVRNSLIVPFSRNWNLRGAARSCRVSRRSVRRPRLASSQHDLRDCRLLGPGS